MHACTLHSRRRCGERPRSGDKGAHYHSRALHTHPRARSAHTLAHLAKRPLADEVDDVVFVQLIAALGQHPRHPRGCAHTRAHTTTCSSFTPALSSRSRPPVALQTTSTTSMATTSTDRAQRARRAATPWPCSPCLFLLTAFGSEGSAAASDCDRSCQTQ